MRVGIVGLGLIGGSFAKAYAEAGHEVLARETDKIVLDFAVMNGTVTAPLTEDNVSSCDLVLLTVPPRAAVACLETLAPFIGPGPVVLDGCGVKRTVCAAGFALAKEHGFTFLGGHPMAGTHNSGFRYARANLFRGAPMVIVPPDFDDILLLDRVKKLLAPVGFGRFSVTTAERHDAMIAFTSQMAHIVSNAYIKSPTAGSHKGFSAGSYKDMTRVAWLDPAMWADLFLENRDFVLAEMDTFLSAMEQYRSALEREDRETLVRLLDEGRRPKEEVDGH